MVEVSNVYIVQVLCAAASGDAGLRVPAHKQLQELESRPGFLNALLEVYADASADSQGRRLAVMLCKNVVDRQWQARSGKGISDEEKVRVKEVILKLLVLAFSGSLPHFVELTMVVRKICRFEFPRSWMELVSFLVAHLQQVQQRGVSDDTLAVIVLLHHVLKEQVSKRLLPARRDFHQIGQVLTEPLGVVWVAIFECMRQEVGAKAGDDRMWKLSRFLDGSFFILLNHGFPHLHDSPNGAQMVALSHEKVAFLFAQLKLRPQLLTSGSFFAKNLKSVLKWTAVLLRSHPLAFGQANVGMVMQIGVEVLEALTGQQRAHPQMKVTGQGLLKSALQIITQGFSTIAYRRGPQQSQQGAAFEAAGVCHRQFIEFVQRQPVGKLCDLCCEVALCIDSEELETWLSDPEDQLQGPGSHTDLRQAGEACIRSLGESPFDRPLVEHVAQRMEEELSRQLTLGEALEAVARKDSLFSLLSLCQPLLKPHLQFQHLLSLMGQVASQVHQMPETSPLVLLPVRLCSVLKSWIADVPQGAAQPTLQIIRSLLQEGRPTAVRLAALGPLRSALDRFSDHEAWAHEQSAFIDDCLGLLVKLHSPEVQWRCLNLVHLFLCEEAASGRYEITGSSLRKLLALWQQPMDGELLIRFALLDVLRALVLMSCRSKQPRLPLSPPLLEFCLAVISDCFSLQRSSGTGSVGAPSNVAATGQEAQAALHADAGGAAGCLGERASASASLLESGTVLFLGVLRTIDAEQAGPLMGFFPQLLSHYAQLPLETSENSVQEILVEYCALHACIPNGQGAAMLLPHYGPLVQLCRRGLEQASGPKDRICEQCLRILQLLLSQAMTDESLGHVEHVVEPLFRLWAGTFNAQSPSAFPYPPQVLMPMFCAWQVRSSDKFRQHAQAAGAYIPTWIVEMCRLVRPVPARAALLLTALAVVEDGVADDAFWREFLQRCDELIQTAEKQATTDVLAQTLRQLKSSLTTKLPIPIRSNGELQRSALPAQFRQALREDMCTLDEVAVLRLFFDHCAMSLRRLGAKGLNVQVLFVASPERVQAAFRATGL
eukprot:TRINITY_DN30555_c0_g1_i1.p1 TRINITY_DN30555_c0_g1~~TRINITY_DN30555_c0_g1_i1.p1  ORF type:complete len:1056 (-),score=166.69 TRINITY_DN30555_c0_g1_i1:141-3308(-)